MDAQNIYLVMVSNPLGTGTGLVKVPLTGGSCTWISQYFADGTSKVGTGPTINTWSPQVFTSALIGSEVVAATGPNPNGNTLFAINIKDGTRRTLSLKNVSAPARSKGAGDAQVGFMGRMASGGAGIATVRAEVGQDYAEFVLVNPSTGDRTFMEPKFGSLKNSGRNSYYNVVAALPGTKQYIVAFGKALHVWDAGTGNSFVLSQ